MKINGKSVIPNSLGHLKALEEYQKPRTDRPATLPLKEIGISERAFQRRDLAFDRVRSEEHVKELARALRSQKKPLDHLLVVPIGARFFLVDGHHRIEAYRQAEWADPVPVEVFEGNLAAARDEAIKRNIKDKLPFSHNDKLEVAWDLVIERNRSKAEINAITTISDGTIATMRRTLASMEKRKMAVESIPWRIAKKLVQEDRDFDAESWREKKAREMAQRLTSEFGSALTKHADVLGDALRMVDRGMPRLLIGHWIDEAREVIEDWDNDEPNCRRPPAFDGSI